VAYQAIREPAQLPEAGTQLGEDLRMDMKMTILKQLRDVTDLACDVAAFANTAGGVLLVGAHEHPKDSGILNAYVPMTFAQTQVIATMLADALRQCSPVPIAEARPIQVKEDSDKYVLAINCDPYAAPPIGVSMSEQQGGEKWWAFPVRRGKDNHNLRPEELATIMEPRLRRILLQIEQIPRGGPDNYRYALIHGEKSVQPFYILDIDILASAMLLRRHPDQLRVVIPLDAIRMIWIEMSLGAMNIGIHGNIVHVDKVGLQFFP
jgi:hypothetical protein